jgi:hypothetical protein
MFKKCLKYATYFLIPNFIFYLTKSIIATLLSANNPPLEKIPAKYHAFITDGIRDGYEIVGKKTSTTIGGYEHSGSQQDFLTQFVNFLKSEKVSFKIIEFLTTEMHQTSLWLKHFRSPNHIQEQATKYGYFLLENDQCRKIQITITTNSVEIKRTGSYHKLLSVKSELTNITDNPIPYGDECQIKFNPEKNEIEIHKIWSSDPKDIEEIILNATEQETELNFS